MIPDLKPEMEELIRRIGQRSTYYGKPVPASIMKMFEIKEDENHIGILVPFWISVLQVGRGPRRSNVDHGLAKKIFNWMLKRNMFRSQTPEGRLSEARSMTWYINKHGNKHFRSKVFKDIYRTERENTIKKIDQKFSVYVSKITMEVI